MSDEARKLRAYQWHHQVMSAFREAVREAHAESRRMGVPIVYFRNGQTYYELPNGDVVRELPKEYEFPPLPEKAIRPGRVTSTPEA